MGTTVARLEAEMSNLEWVRWEVYFGRRAQDAQLARGGKS